jgi:uncharacterized protein YutE (UPF0331/DUF86 family)
MNKLRIITTIIVTILFSWSTSYGDGNESKIDELIDKHQSRIAKANHKDWKTYAECANSMVEMRIANDEILSWINKSIDIKETVYNRTVRGDFLILQKKFTDAKKEYIKAICLAQKTGEKYKIPDIQWKILIAMGIENYTNFHTSKE